MLNSKLSKLLQWLTKHGYLLAAFFVPLMVRSIPEILSWPYPLGLDTLNVMPQIQNAYVFSLGPVGFLQHTNLFYLIATLLYELFHNVVTAIKILGPLLLAALSFTMYLYARKGLCWSNKKSLLVSILVATYFVSLRDSWDLYRQTLGLVFLMAALISLKTFNSPRRYYAASFFMVLTVFSHELASVILFFVVVLEAARFLVKKLRKESVYLLASAALPVALFLFQWYSPQHGTLVVPSSIVASGPSINLAVYMAGLLIYCYAIILPLVFLGIKSLRDRVLKYWALLCVGIVLIEMLDPNAPLYFWNRWVYLLVYPLLFFAVQGLERLWHFAPNTKGKIKRLLPKVFAIAYIFSLLVLSGYYLTTSPENAFPYFSQYNPYLAEIPSSMLQNTLSINDNPSLVACFEWLNNNTTENSVIMSHYALYNLAVIYIPSHHIVIVDQGPSMWANLQNGTTLADQMLSTAKEYSAGGHVKVYTVWWISGDGWYGIRSLPSDFKEVYYSGKMAVYLYNPGV
jgi:hypothetical protein